MAEACKRPPVPEQRAKGITEEGRSIKGRKAVDRSTRSAQPEFSVYIACQTSLTSEYLHSSIG
jgi:hypothetical protein